MIQNNNNKKLLFKLSIIPIGILLIVCLVFYWIYKSKEIRDIKLEKENIQILVNQEYRIEYTIVPDAAKEEALLWVTDNENAINLDHGVIYGKAMGEANVWVNPINKPELKKKITVVVTTKRGLFKEILVSDFGYKTIDKVKYRSNDFNTIINFEDNTLTEQKGGLTFIYHFTENYIEASSEGYGSGRIHFDVESYYQTCSSDQKEWCERSEESALSENQSILERFRLYLGNDTTVEDLR